MRDPLAELQPDKEEERRMVEAEGLCLLALLLGGNRLNIDLGRGSWAGMSIYVNQCQYVPVCWQWFLQIQPRERVETGARSVLLRIFGIIAGYTAST